MLPALLVLRLKMMNAFHAILEINFDNNIQAHQEVNVLVHVQIKLGKMVLYVKIVILDVGIVQGAIAQINVPNAT